MYTFKAIIFMMHCAHTSRELIVQQSLVLKKDSTIKCYQLSIFLNCSVVELFVTSLSLSCTHIATVEKKFV